MFTHSHVSSFPLLGLFSFGRKLVWAVEVQSYYNFERATVKYRLQVAAGHHERLRKILRAKKVLCAKTRHRIWRVMIQTAQLYALEATEVTKEGMRLIHVQTRRHLRGIYGSARRVDGLSDEAFLEKFGIPNPQQSVKDRCVVLLHRLSSTAQEHQVPCFDATNLGKWAQQVLDSLPHAHVARSRPQYPSASTNTSLEPSPDKQVHDFKCSVCELSFATLHELTNT